MKHYCSNRFLCKYDCTGKGDDNYSIYFNYQRAHLCKFTKVVVREDKDDIVNVEFSEGLFVL